MSNQLGRHFGIGDWYELSTSEVILKLKTLPFGGMGVQT
jgi:hypothetical protein